MRSLSWCLGLLLLASCAGEQVAPFARLNGVHGLTHVGTLVFVTSSQGSELRVIDSLPDEALRRKEPGFLRAPNPLNLLSIPVLDRPVRLTPDLRWDGGAEVRGPYLYVEGAGAREISVVAAAPEFLSEAARLSTNGPVTSVAGMGPASEADPSLLFHAEDQAGLGRLFRTVLAGPSLLASTPPVTDPVRLVDGSPIAFADETLVAMTVLPRASDGGVRLAVALRGALGLTGRAFLLSLDPTGAQLTAAPQELAFGAPVRELRTHPAFERVKRVPVAFPLDFPADTDGDSTPDGYDPGLPAGARIFGVLDEASCGGGTACRGVVAVDAIDFPQADPHPDLTLGERSLDARGLPMIPVADGNAILQGLALQPRFAWIPPQPDIRNPPVNVLDLGGVFSAGNGNYTVFDADGLQQLNLSTSGPSFVTATLRLVDAAGAAITGFSLDLTAAQLVPGAADLSLNPGVIREETIAFTYQGGLPGLGELPVSGTDSPRVDVSGSTLQLTPTMLAARVRPGDVVSGTGAGCETPLEIASVDPVAGTVTTSAAPPAGCTALTFSAGTVDPWVVRGSLSGHLGRTADGAVFVSEPGTPFAHLPAYVAGAPAMTLRFVLPPGYIPSAGQALTVVTTDGFAPLRSRVDSGVDTQGFPTLYLPGQLTVLDRSPFYGAGSLWVTYPSANAVISFSPLEIDPLASFRNLLTYQ